MNLRYKDPGVKPGCPALLADSLPSEPPGKPSKDLKLKQKSKQNQKKKKERKKITQNLQP